MEAVYLLLSIASTFLKSTFLSLLLALKSIVNLLLSSSNDSNSNSRRIFLYEGHVRHVRRSPVAHSFDYPVRYALFDLDQAPQRSDHLSADAARHIASTNGPVFLLTIPTSVGYAQNPLSVYYCYDVVVDEDKEEKEIKELKTCIAKVTNTPWGESVMFGFMPGSDLVAKPLHVSPFMVIQEGTISNIGIRAFGKKHTCIHSLKNYQSKQNSINQIEAGHYRAAPDPIARLLKLRLSLIVANDCPSRRFPEGRAALCPSPRFFAAGEINPSRSRRDRTPASRSRRDRTPFAAEHEIGHPPLPPIETPIETPSELSCCPNL